MRIPCLRGLVLSSFTLIFFAADLYAQNFVYTDNNNFGPNTVTAFSVAANGALTPVAGSPFATGGTGTDRGFFASNRARTCVVGSRLYITNEGSDNVSGFNINPTTGALTPVPGSPFATGGASSGIGISLDCTRDGHFLIAASSGSSNITVFSIAADGSLTPVAGSPFPAGGEPDGIRVSPAGPFLAVALADVDRVAMFSIAANGALTPVPGSPFASPATGIVTGIEINCAGTILFAAQAGGPGTAVDVFSIGANGALTLIQSFYNMALGSNSNVAVLSPNQQFLFVSNQASNTITVFNVAPNGMLSPLAGSPFADPGGASPQQLATDQAGTFLYANNENGVVSVFSIAANGALSSVAGSPFAAGSGQRPGIAAFPPASCGVTFDVCLQDDSNGNLLRFNTTTGEYLFTRCGTGFMLGGTGTVTIKGSIVTLQHNAADRKVLAQIDNAMKNGKASVQVFSLGTTFTITDRNTTNDTCACP